MSMAGSEIEARAPGAPNAYPFRLAEPRYRMRERIEHRLQVEGRAANSLEHLRGSRLLLQRFGEIVRALAQFLQKSRILDGDDGLGGKVRHQLDMLACERPDLLAIDVDCADQLIGLKHWHRDYRPIASEVDGGD